MTRLRSARQARGWSQVQLIHELSREAAADGLVIPGRESMRIMLSRWENGHVQPEETYRQYLCAVYGSDELSLGLTRANGTSTPTLMGAGVRSPVASTAPSRASGSRLQRTGEDRQPAGTCCSADRRRVRSPTSVEPGRRNPGSSSS